MSAPNPAYVPVVTPLREAAGALRELYLELRAVGFTERQALYVVATLITGPSAETLP